MISLSFSRLEGNVLKISYRKKIDSSETFPRFMKTIRVLQFPSSFFLPFSHLCTHISFSLLLFTLTCSSQWTSRTLHVTKVALHAVVLTASLHLTGRALLEKVNSFNSFLNLLVLHLVRTKKPCLGTAYSIIVMNSFAGMILFKVNGRIYKKLLKHESIRYREIKFIFCFLHNVYKE